MATASGCYGVVAKVLFSRCLTISGGDVGNVGEAWLGEPGKNPRLWGFMIFPLFKSVIGPTTERRALDFDDLAFNWCGQH